MCRLIFILLFAICGCATSALHQQKADERAASADSWFRVMQQRWAAKEPLTPAFVDEVLRCSKARAEAHAAAANDQAGRFAAYKQHRDFCEEKLKYLSQLICGEPSAALAARLRYEIADAEYHMAE